MEDKANGPALIAMLQREIPGIIAVRPDGNKQARAAFDLGAAGVGQRIPAAPESGAVEDDFVEECAAFPKGAHNDQVDCCTPAQGFAAGVARGAECDVHVTIRCGSALFRRPGEIKDFPASCFEQLKYMSASVR